MTLSRLLVTIAVLALGLALALAAAPKPPKPPVWPNQFSIAFVDAGGFPGMMFYDWDIKAQRVDHAAGASECTHFLNTNASCSLLFGPSSWNAFFPSNKTCCTGEAPGLIKPDFVKSQAYHGVVSCPCNKALQCDFWGGNDQGEHKYFSVVKTGVPCAFLFTATTSGNFLFDPKSFKVGPQNPKKFETPSPCVNPCPTNQ